MTEITEKENQWQWHKNTKYKRIGDTVYIQLAPVCVKEFTSPCLNLPNIINTEKMEGVEHE